MKRKAKIYYIALDDFWRKEEKLEWLRDNPIEKIAFEHITPDEKHNWINQTDNDFETLLSLVEEKESIFINYFNGISTNRDEWVYANDKAELLEKIKFFTDEYNRSVKQNIKTDKIKIKWSSSLEAIKKRRERIRFNKDKVITSLFRPFIKKFFYSDKYLNDRLTGNHYLAFGENLDKHNLVINFNNNEKDNRCLSTDGIVDLHFVGDTKCLPLYIYENSQKHENITDWGLTQFQTYYKSSNGATITKQDIFYYTYAVLHSPQYRKKYEQNLKREFPRLPFYEDFTKWRDWGERLMDLHINYETQEPFALERKDLDLTPKLKNKQDNLFGSKAEMEDKPFIVKPKIKLRPDKVNNTIEIDSHTTLTGIPKLAWEYKLGNRSALEWILDQYKEKKPQDATIAERFNSYKFEDYKEQTIDLLKRVCSVSVKTMEIVKQMPKAD